MDIWNKKTKFVKLYLIVEGTLFTIKFAINEHIIFAAMNNSSLIQNEINKLSQQQKEE
ncbi:hypothetical protein pb186bvf_003177 [Paramecium bursaria]